LSDIVGGDVIPPAKLAYFRQRLRNRLHRVVLSEFSRLASAEGLTKKSLAQRIGRKPEQITRWLTASGNWTLDTLSDLLLGMGTEPSVTIGRFADTAMAPTLVQPDWETNFIIIQSAVVVGTTRNVWRTGAPPSDTASGTVHLAVTATNALLQPSEHSNAYTH